jgi:hypothetical protein
LEFERNCLLDRVVELKIARSWMNMNRGFF